MSPAVQRRNLQVAADLFRKELFDFPMPRHGGDFSESLIHVNRMAAPFSKKATAMLFEMPNQVNAFHALVRLGVVAARE